MRLLALALLVPLTGCAVANAAVDVATLPVKAVSKGVDLATTSQSEADEKRGRALRKAEEDFGRRHRQWTADCQQARARGWACLPEPHYVAPTEQ
ncbi:MAG TPA: hypothetical protein VHM21_01390 [Sphingomicrobium sp.]|jgi:hypothetical protein|nr:hypothetical protein [Sphingomicrobium sp.]